MNALKQLKAWGACSEGYEWTKAQGIETLPELWQKLQRPDWMMWLAEQQGLKLDECKLRLFACDCAEQVLPMFERDYPNDDRPRKCIEVARRYANWKATEEERDAARAAAGAAAWDAARDAARAAARDATRAAAGDAARAAAGAAAWDAAGDAAGDAAWAAARDAAWDAAWAAAGAAAWDAARDAARAAAWAYQADKLRSYFPNPFATPQGKESAR